MRRRLFALPLLLPLLLPAPARGEAGVLVPENVSGEPDASLLVQKEIDVTVQIDHLHATVRMKQIFENRGDRPLQARYVLALGAGASVEDFAVWDGPERLRAVVVERKKGRRLFDQIAAQRLDPGLVETEDERDKGRKFALRIAPIPPRGTARIEIVLSEDLPLSSGAALFTLPLSARRDRLARAQKLRVEISAKSYWPLKEARLSPPGRARFLEGPGKGGLRALWEATDVALDADLTLELGYEGTQAKPRTLAYRDPRPRQDLDPFSGGAQYNDQRGFFLVQDLFAPPAAQAAPRDVVLLLDTSLSMAGEKLDRAFFGLGHVLSQLGPRDRFGLLLLSDEPQPFRRALVPASAAAAAEALAFVRASYLSGGTALSPALFAAEGLLVREAGRERFIVLLSDGHPTRGELSRKALSAQAAALQKRAVSLFALAVGDDANVDLLRGLAARSGGAFAWVPEGQGGQGGDFAVRSLAAQLGQPAWQGLELAAPGLSIEQVFAASPGPVFAGADVMYLGRYRTPGKGLVRLSGSALGRPYERTAALDLPAEDRAHPFVARSWARLRIEELLGRIAEAGESADWIREITALGKEFRLVTPYTSFLAAPRALLRPRSMQPGDPLLRVRAPKETRRVAALFPFGLQKALRYLPREDLWETRFVAPPWMTDGTYQCTLILTDDKDRKHREEKTFVIDSRPPTVRLKQRPPAVRPGAALSLVADADPDVRRLEARLAGGPPTHLRWDGAKKGSVGALPVPADLPPGTYPLVLVAEDFAHNVATYETQVDVLAGAL